MGVSIIVRGPEWFFGLDSLFEGFAAIALLLVTLFSYKAYKLTKDRRYRTFGIAFGLMMVGVVARALADLFVYADIKAHPLALMALYAGYMGLTLVSIITLFALTLKIRQRAPVVALLLVSLVLVMLSASYRLSFHSISVILLAFIAYHFIRNYFEKKSLSALLVCISFILLTLTHAAFIVDIVKQRFYIIGHLLHLAAFGLLFVALVKVLKKR
jgi:cellobiose-specific phosphotransferase system component IIC